MADSKITALDNLTSADPANDMIPIVDVSATPPASGNTKRISINNLLACSPSATLASATITGDLTVATNTLKTTSGNVGIGTVTPDIFSRFYTRTIGFNSNGSTVMQINGSSYSGIDLGAGGTRTLGIASSATDASLTTLTNIPIVFGINSTEAMRLNATGLVVGATSALSKLTVAGSNLTTASWGISSIYSTDSAAIDKGGSITFGGSFTGTTTTYWAQISGRKENSTDSDVAGYLALSSRPTGGLTTDRMRVKSNGQIRFIPLAADPSGAEAGDVYYNSSSNKLKCYNGSTWNDLF